MSIRPDDRGSLWHKWDLHLHTPSSYDYDDKSITNQQIIDKLIEKKISVVAITDHHIIDVSRIRELQRLGNDRITILPGIEFRSDQGGDPIHYISIFSEECDLEHVWDTLKGQLGLTPEAIRQKGGDQCAYVPIEDCFKATCGLDGIITIHAGAKSNSIESIKNKEQFQQRIKLDITSKYVDIMEIGQLKDIAVHRNVIFPDTGLDKPLIICSDNHDIKNYDITSPLWLRADPTFRGLLMIIREPQWRSFIGECPPDHIRLDQNPTKYIRCVSFQRKATAASPDKWFSGSVVFNPGLVAIVGNKGSGKSALSDTIGLLGSNRNTDSFSFLSEERFRHPVGGHANDFTATLEWASGEKTSRCLNESPEPGEIERVKYLPQDYVEDICNELSGIGDQAFEQELKAVIFSHIPLALRIEQSTLDDLVRFRTEEKQKRIDTLLKQLRELSRTRSVLEIQAEPNAKHELQEKLKQRELELVVHDKSKPVEILNPLSQKGSQPVDADLSKQMIDAETLKKTLDEKINKEKENLRVAERRYAVAKRLLEKIANYQKEYTTFIASLDADIKELKINPVNIIMLKIDDSLVKTINDETLKQIIAIKQQLEETQQGSLANQLLKVQGMIVDLQTKLDAPNRKYQAYLKTLHDWQEKRDKIEGIESETESIKGLKALLVAQDGLPNRIKAILEEQMKLAIAIHDEKLAQSAIYRTIYEPVQRFMDTHALAKDKLKLEFRAELANHDFVDRFFAIISQRPQGSFRGIDEGRKMVGSYLQSTNWEKRDSVIKFLSKIDNDLHFDNRDGSQNPVQLRDQLLQGKKLENVFDLVYGLEYIQPKYILRWEGKDISMLSPGERGTLLLVFYLLIDLSDIPLIIDQPEGNLDNHTVAKVLVDCIREARKRRQVVIVTHNPNLAVVCDAEQVIHANLDKANGNAITYTSGALENPKMSLFITDVLEGTLWAFDKRGDKYEVGCDDE